MVAMDWDDYLPIEDFVCYLAPKSLHLLMPNLLRAIVVERLCNRLPLN